MKSSRSLDVGGKSVLIYTMGIEGRDLARWMVAQGAIVTMSDTRTEAQLAAAGATTPTGVSRLVCGEPLLDAEGFELVATGQSVLRHNPAIVRARKLGIPCVSQMELFLDLCPAPVIGITGASGKSTTTALVGAMAAAAGLNPVLGGNLGEALLGRLSDILPGSTVVLEISHTQLQYTTRSPRIAAVTNVTPNHLDQFSWDEYVGLKRNILLHQGSDDIAVLNADDHTSRQFVAEAKGQVLRTSIKGEIQGNGAWFEADKVRVRYGGRAQAVVHRSQVRLRGEHNLANVTMACAIAAAAGFPIAAMTSAIEAFRGIPHRLEVVGRALGATWVNDSIATSPERTVAGLNAFTEPVVLLLGGREKRLPLDLLQRTAAARCRAVICFGEAGELFYEALRGVIGQVRPTSSLSDAIELATALVQPGDAVLLSPAGTSFDAFPSFEARGQAFRDLVRALPGFEEVV